MAGVVSGLVLVGALCGVTGSCVILAARLYRAGLAREPRKRGHS
jgi:hypothetical protein